MEQGETAPSRNQGKDYRRNIFRNKKSLERRVGSRRSKLVYFLWIQIISKLKRSKRGFLPPQATHPPTAHHTNKRKKPFARGAAKGFRAIFGSGLLSHMTLCSIIGDGELNFRVRNGVGCTLSSMATKEICQNILIRGGRILFEKQDARAISTGQLHASRRFHLRPINEVVYLGPSGLASGRTYLKAGFPLRCFQRLSLPHLATLLCRWHDNRSTSGVSIPVLSY